MAVTTKRLREEQKPETKQERKVRSENSEMIGGICSIVAGEDGCRSRNKTKYADNKSENDSMGGEGWERRNGEDKKDCTLKGKKKIM